MVAPWKVTLTVPRSVFRPAEVGTRQEHAASPLRNLADRTCSRVRPTVAVQDTVPLRT